MYYFSYLEPVCCSMSSSNCCFLTCIQIPQEAGQVVLYSHLFHNFSEFVVVHTIKGFGIVNKAEVDIFLNSLVFSMIQRVLAIWSLVPLPFLNPAWMSGSSWFTYCWSLVWRFWALVYQHVRWVQCSHVRLSATPSTAALQVSLSTIKSWSLLRLMSIESVMPSNHLILCHPLLLLPSVFPGIRVFSNESVLCIRWPKYWSFSFSISPSNEY